MPFTGKATYSAGPSLPEVAEDVSDLLGIVSPYETPLLDHLGDPQRAATSTVHEWLEDELLPNTDTAAANATDAETTLTVNNANRFRVGDQVQPAGSPEIMLVTTVPTTGGDLTVVRGYGSTASEAITSNQELIILGNAALEGGEAPDPRFTNRSRKQNVTQIFTAAVEVSGSQLAAQQLAVADEMDYQKTERLRELMRDLENCVINGVSAGSNPQGDTSTRRTMTGVIAKLSTHVADASGAALSEAVLNASLREIWEQSSGTVDTIVVSGLQKRKINSFITASRQYAAQAETFKDMVSVYESDFGVCRVVLSRWVPADMVLLLDSSRMDVLPLSGRSFFFQELAATGDRAAGQLIGEYTLELRNENAHGVIRNLQTS